MNDDTAIRLETALAHQEQQIQELGDMVNSQWKEIERLNRRIDKLLAKLEDDTDQESGQREALSVTDIAAANKPPHY